jgi:ABC-2 type transport system ATP-binding protein
MMAPVRPMGIDRKPLRTMAPDPSTSPPSPAEQPTDAPTIAVDAGPGREPDPSPGDVVSVHAAHKAFGDVAALTDLSLSVPQGRITVLLGPNGAGKTTAIRLVTGALGPDEGTVRTFGLDPAADGEQVRMRCGVVSAKPALYDRLSGRNNLAYAAELYGLGRRADRQITEAAGRFGISHALDQQVGGYSTGMKTRLALARSILHGPDLLLFDEPTSGLDPESSAAVLALIRHMTEEGRTVVMCTHLLVEAEGLADQVIILEAGTDLLTGPPQELTKRFWPNPLVRIDAEQRDALDVLAAAPGVLGYRRAGAAELELDDLGRIPDLVFALATEGVRVTRVEPHQPTLEELYFAVREERRREVAGLSRDGGPVPVASGPVDALESP